MRLILRNKNIYGLWVGIWTVSKMLCILWNEGGEACPGGPPGVPRSMWLNVPYHKEHGLGRVFWTLMMGPCPKCYIPSFMQIGPAVPEKKIFEVFFYYIWAWRPPWSCDLDHPVVPRSMSLNAPYLKEQEYIWIMGGDLNGLLRYYAFYEMKGVGHAPGGPPGVARSCYT